MFTLAAGLVVGLVPDPTIPTSFRICGFLQIFVGLILALPGVLAVFALHYWKWVCIAAITAGVLNVAILILLMLS